MLSQEYTMRHERNMQIRNITCNNGWNDDYNNNNNSNNSNKMAIS